MQRSFSIVMDDDSGDNEENYDRKTADSESSPHDFEESSRPSKIPSAGPSGRHLKPSKTRLSSDSDSEDAKPLPGEYDPKEYEHLDVSAEMRDIFQYIAKYIPQTMTLDHRFKPFVPEFLPAVGDIDAFLKVVPPAAIISGDVTDQRLGLVVLDEPAANQSDAALLHLQLRADSVQTAHDSDMVVKKLDNVEKNARVVDKWIKDITALHKSKSFPVVRYTEPMPDLDELMQEWPEEMEKKLKESHFPEPNGSLDDYIEEVCGLFRIPVKNKIEALHMLFSLFAAVKSSQLFKNSQLEKSEVVNDDLSENVADQLVLE